MRKLCSRRFAPMLLAILIRCYSINTDEIPGFFLFLKKIISSSRAVKILFLSFTFEDISVAMVTYINFDFVTENILLLSLFLLFNFTS